MDQTPNFKLALPPFDLRLWHTSVNTNFDIIDAVLGHYLNVENLRGVWQNSTVYNVGDRAVDADQGAIYECALGNTSAPVPTTFTQERANNPFYWRGVTVQQAFRGTWTNSTSYSVNDFVVSGNIYAVCATSHTSVALPGVFGDDAVYWIYLINLTGNVLPSIAGHGGSYVRAMPSEAGTEYRTPTQMRADLGISNVVTSFNTRIGDVNLTLTDITSAGGAPLNSPGLTGTPTAPTAAPATSTTQLATTAFVTNAVGIGGGGAYAVVGPTPPNPASPSPSPPMGLLFADTSVPDPLTTVTVANDVGRNKLHNSMFRIQQRGAGPWSAQGFTADRWALYVSLDTTSEQILAATDTDRSQIGDEAAAYKLSLTATGNAGAGAYTFISQSIEGVRGLAGKTVTISFWAAAGAVGLKVGVSVGQSFGSGGSPSAVVVGNNIATFAAADGAWHRYTCTTTLPSVAGKTLGTNGDDYTFVRFWLSSGATNNAAAGTGVQSGTVVFWGMQLEPGTLVTPLEKMDIALERVECMRFYQIGQFQQFSYGAASGTAQQSYAYPVTMRATPTLTPTFTTQTNCGSSSSASLSAANYLTNTTVTALGSFNLAGTFTASADL